MEKYNVFLGGTCAESTWREQLMPMLDKFNITYFNPVVDDWTEECQVIENWHKENDDYNLFVITKEMQIRNHHRHYFAYYMMEWKSFRLSH